MKTLICECYIHDWTYGDFAILEHHWARLRGVQAKNRRLLRGTDERGAEHAAENIVMISARMRAKIVPQYVGASLTNHPMAWKQHYP